MFCVLSTHFLKNKHIILTFKEQKTVSPLFQVVSPVSVKQAGYYLKAENFCFSFRTFPTFGLSDFPKKTIFALL
jgi:hypothetical protein